MAFNNNKQKKGRRPSSFTCMICTDIKATTNMFTSSECSHSFCKDCISKHIAAKIEDNNIANVKCPDPSCKAMLDPNMCHSFVPKEVLERWGDALFEALILGIQRLFCPFVDCSAMLIDDSNETVTAAECPSCRRMFCAKCNVEWHEEIECEEFQKLNLEKEGRDDLMVMLLAIQKKWKRCPNCKVYVERIEGCSHIACLCGSQFCYSCGAKWGGDHACPESADARRYHH